MKNFLKTAAHQHKDPQVRLSYVAEIDAGAEDSQQMLCAMAQQDQDLRVRIAAISRLDELNVLRELLDASTEDDSELREAAENRLVEKLTNGEVSDVAARALLSDHSARLAVPIACHCSISEQREMALESLADEHALVSIVQQSRFHDTRSAAAMRLSHHDSLRTALAAVRSKDKAVAKQLQQRLDAEAAAEADLIERRHKVAAMLQSAESLSQGVWTPQHEGKLKAIREKWTTIDQADRHGCEERFLAAINQAEKDLEAYNLAQSSAAQSETEHSQVQPEKLNANPESDKPVEAEPDPSLVPVLSEFAECELAQLGERIASWQSADTSNPEKEDTDHPPNPVAAKTQPSGAVTQYVSYLNAVAVLFDPPYDINKARPNALKTRIKRVSALLDVKSLLPGSDISGHRYFVELGEHEKSLNNRLAKAEQESADRIKATHRQFAALSGIIEEGKWGPANSMMRRLKKKIDAMENAERVSLNKKLELAETQLEKMADWQDFAARPKLEALCELMEALPAQELAPDALAKQVRAAQSSWKSLGVSRASNELWARFKTAGDKAYEPCKAYFDEKQQERQKKLDAKAALCVALEAESSTLDDEPDWKAIVRRVNNAKREWTRNRIADRKPDKALEARFSKALEPYENALTVQYDANAAAKQELIDKVQALAEGEITQHSANQAKRLLSTWKLVGVMRRKEDQALWEVFNSHLGTIFKHQHKVEREKQRAGLEHVFRAKDIIKRLKVLSRADTLDEGELQTLVTEFQALAEFPERDKKFLLRDFRQATDACARVQDTASKRRLQASHEETSRLVGLCEQLEMAVEDPDSVDKTVIDDVIHAWDASDVKVASDIGAALIARRDKALSHISAGTKPDYDANEVIRRDLLVRMEVSAGIETPAEDKSRRMQYQLEHLQQGMTSAGVDDVKLTLANLEYEWNAAGPVRGVVKDTLNSRFLKAYRR